jgi:hypothetical protein
LYLLKARGWFDNDHEKFLSAETIDFTGTSED